MGFPLLGKVIFFATNNINKFNEARYTLAEYKLAIGMLRVKGLEIQSEDLEEIAKISALDAYRKCHLPVIVEDAGLFIDALNGFPGPYAAYFYKTIGNKGLLQIMTDVENRKARFKSVIAYCFSESEPPSFYAGEVEGEMVREERRGNAGFGFGFDPIFKPTGSHKTFAEMGIMEKNNHSHRSRALRGFAEWYRKV